LLQLGPLALIGLFYARRARALTRHAHPQPRWRAICFYCGLALIAGTLTGLDSASEELLYAHMIEHLLVGDLAALLIVLGLTGPPLAPLLRNKLIDRLRALSHPAIAFPLWTLDLYLWHAPALYEAALRHPGIHALEHLCFVGFGVNMWMCLLGPLPTPRWFGNLARLDDRCCANAQPAHREDEQVHRVRKHRDADCNLERARSQQQPDPRAGKNADRARDDELGH